MDGTATGLPIIYISTYKQHFFLPHGAQEEEMPGTMTLERLEKTSYLLGRSQQLRMQFEPFTYGGTNMGILIMC